MRLPVTGASLLWCLCALPALAQPLDANALYRAGRMNEAAAAYAQQLSAERASAQPTRLWAALMAAAWFEEATGQHPAAIEHSNEALQLAERLDDPFRRGRSLAWLGWSWASLGHYSMAVRFYQAAIALGAPSGKVVLVPVWGLAQQELGAVYFRQGQLQKAKAAVQATYDFARQHGIAVGVAEGGAHLAEMALYEGQAAKAERLAREALKAARDCDCSETNKLRALVAVARAVAAQAKLEAPRRDEARRLAQQALEEAKAFASPRYQAEAELVLASLSDTEPSRRLALTSAALERLSSTDDELRGQAELSLGDAWLAAHQEALARFYTARGVRVTAELLREVDRAWAMGQLGALDQLPGAKGDPFAHLGEQADAAESSGNLPAALEAHLALAKALQTAGYHRLAQQQAGDALIAVRALLGGEASEKQKQAWRQTELALLDQLAQLRLRRPDVLAPTFVE